MEKVVACAWVMNGDDMVLVVAVLGKEVNRMVGLCALVVNGDDMVLAEEDVVNSLVVTGHKEVGNIKVEEESILVVVGVSILVAEAVNILVEEESILVVEVKSILVGERVSILAVEAVNILVEGGSILKVVAVSKLVVVAVRGKKVVGDIWEVDAYE
ncbi:hypothetical protein Fot_42269 [Forsythia ovata]|uniref:Uncharacterized protein n=1 Tax=Forsythia ovata TaxID=205694 RepID=A0ABD1RM64_9LAMI